MTKPKGLPLPVKEARQLEALLYVLSRVNASHYPFLSEIVITGRSVAIKYQDRYAELAEQTTSLPSRIPSFMGERLRFDRERISKVLRWMVYLLNLKSKKENQE